MLSRVSLGKRRRKMFFLHISQCLSKWSLPKFSISWAVLEENLFFHTWAAMVSPLWSRLLANERWSRNDTLNQDKDPIISSLDYITSRILRLFSFLQNHFLLDESRGKGSRWTAVASILITPPLPETHGRQIVWHVENPSYAPGVYVK